MWFVPSLAGCRDLGRVLDKVCDWFRSSILFAFLGDIFDSFCGFCEYHDSFDAYRLGLLSAAESIVLRSGMLSFVDCPGLICWLGARLPVVELRANGFRTPSDLVGACVPMRNFGEGGYVAHVEYDGDGLVVPVRSLL